MSEKAWGWIFKEIKQPFEKLEILPPVLKPNEVLVKNTFATICASDLHTFYGRRKSKTESVLGHETVGVVQEIAEGGATDFFGKPLQKNDRVSWAVYACNHQSEMAKKGIPQKAPDLYKYGHESISEEIKLNGGFATHSHLLAGTAIFKLPKNITNKVAAPINCTHATVAGAMRLAGSLKNKIVLVNGAGMLGLSACAMAKEAGSKSVIACDVLPEKLELAKQFGANATCLANQTNMQNYNQNVDVVVETSGYTQAIESVFKTLAIGGTMVLVGAVFPQPNWSVCAEKIVRNVLTIKGLHNYTPQDLASAISFVAANEGKYPFEKLVSKSFTLPELQQAFTTAEKKEDFRVGLEI